MTGRRILLWTAAAVFALLTMGAFVACGLTGIIPLIPATVLTADLIYQWQLGIRLRREMRAWLNHG